MVDVSEMKLLLILTVCIQTTLGLGGSKRFADYEDVNEEIGPPGMVKRYHCTEEWVPVEEAMENGRGLQFKNEMLEKKSKKNTKPKTKPEDTAIEDMLNDEEDATPAPVKPMMTPQKTPAMPISQLSEVKNSVQRSTSKPFFVYDFDNYGMDYEDTFYRFPRRRFGRRGIYNRRRMSPQFGGFHRTNKFGRLQVVGEQQEEDTTIEPLQSAQNRLMLSTIAPPEIVELAERIDPIIKTKRIRYTPGLVPLPLATTPRPSIFADGKLEEATPTNCKKIRTLATAYGIKNISAWARNNCATLHMFIPSATCQQLWHFIDSCNPTAQLPQRR